MILSETNPFVRYARYLDLCDKSHFKEVIPLDARLFYTLNGYSKIKIKNTEYEMSPGALLIVNSGIPYHILTPENTVSYIIVNFDYTQKASSRNVPVKPVLKNKFKDEMLIDFNTFDDIKQLSEILYIERIERIQKKLSDIVSEYSKKMLYHEQKTSHILADCITDCVRYLELGNSFFEKESSNRILTYIHANYNKKLSNSAIGKIFGYHPNHVSFLIKRITGMPLHKYTLHIRLMNASNLLDNTALSIDEIALQCGFLDSAYFSAYFKKQFGISPSKYRNI